MSADRVSSARDNLTAMLALAQKATPGPWSRPLDTRYRDFVSAPKPDDEQGQYTDDRPEIVGVVKVGRWSDGRFMRKRSGRDLDYIAAASPDLLTRVCAEALAVLDRHGIDVTDCRECWRFWPCPEVEAIVRTWAP